MVVNLFAWNPWICRSMRRGLQLPRRSVTTCVLPEVSKLPQVGQHAGIAGFKFISQFTFSTCCPAQVTSVLPASCLPQPKACPSPQPSWPELPLRAPAIPKAPRQLPVAPVPVLPVLPPRCPCSCWALPVPPPAAAACGGCRAQPGRRCRGLR